MRMQIVQDNLKKLENYGFEIINPANGYLACGDTGAGKMPEPETLFAYIMRTIACKKDMQGKHVLVTAGATMEKIESCTFYYKPFYRKDGKGISRKLYAAWS